MNSNLTNWLIKNLKHYEEQIAISNHDFHLRSTGYISIDLDRLNEFIYDSLDTGLIKKDKKVIDMGSGLGFSTLIWASHGFNTTGVEINDELYKKSLDLTAKIKHLINGEAFKFVNGSYFPPDYIEKRRKLKAVNLENYLTETKDCGRVFYPWIKNENFSNSLKDFDIFHGFFWDVQMPSVLEIFSNYAKPDAVLVSRFVTIGEGTYNHRYISIQNEFPVKSIYRDDYFNVFVKE